MREEIIKICSCGIEYTQAGWDALQYAGVQKNLKGEVILELRNCVCESTIAILIGGGQTHKEK